MDSFSDEEKTVQLYDRQGNYAGELSFPADAIQYNPVIGELYVGASDAALCYNDYYYDDDDENDRKMKADFLAKIVQSVTIQRVQAGKLHYVV
jgi:hypothetical protein